MKLNFNLSSCIRASSISSNCEKCLNICPTKTIKLENNIPSFTPDECVLCGGCVGICPTEAFSLDGFNVVEFIFNYFETNDILSCHKTTPCLAIFSPEALISLALGNKEDVVLDIGHCETCNFAENLYTQIKHNIDEANFILSTFCKKRLVAKNIKFENTNNEKDTIDRRTFLNNLKPINLLKTKKTFEEKIDGNKSKKFDFDENIINQIKTKSIPDMRKLFFTLLKNQEKPLVYETIDSNEISFMSQKYIDNNCTNCQMCYRICPTEALSSDKNHSIINFNAMLCLKCNLCHDVCMYNSIHLQQAFDIKEFFEPTKKIMAHFDIKRCTECNNNFTYFGGEVICPRCAIEEEEAISLHKNKNKDF